MRLETMPERSRSVLGLSPIFCEIAGTLGDAGDHAGTRLQPMPARSRSVPGLSPIIGVNAGPLGDAVDHAGTLGDAVGDNAGTVS